MAKRGGNSDICNIVDNKNNVKNRGIGGIGEKNEGKTETTVIELQ